MDSVTVAFELMRLEMQAQVENLNAEGAKRFRESKYDEATHLSKRGKSLHDFLNKVCALELEWITTFVETKEVNPHDPHVQTATHRILANSTAPNTSLLVRFPNGAVIAEADASDTLVLIIKRAGIEHVEQLGILVNGENLRIQDTFNSI